MEDTYEQPRTKLVESALDYSQCDCDRDANGAGADEARQRR